MSITKSKVHWYEVEILNCKLEANSNRPRRQIHKVSATSLEDARELAPRVLSCLFGRDTYVGDIKLWC